MASGRHVCFAWVALAVACAGSKGTPGFGASGGGSGRGSSGGSSGGGGTGAESDASFGSLGYDGASGGPAPNPCPNGQHTTITGTTYAPNGTLPLYDVMVYVPEGALPPLASGVSCDRCGPLNSTKVLASALSDATGKFVLTDPPAGTNVPLVVQVGKWRRRVILPLVNACTDNPIGDPNLTRLPKNRQEGDMPHIAVTTGFCDNLSCLLPKVGVDPNELGIDGDDKAVIHFHGGAMASGSSPSSIDPSSWGPNNMTPAATLWGDSNKLMSFDMAIFSCECGEPGSEVPSTGYDNVTKYLAAGGRVFGTDYQYVWYENSTDPNLAGAMMIRGGEYDVNQGPVDIVTTFPKGKALADWMQFVDAKVTYGEISPAGIFDHILGQTSAVQVWATSLDNSDSAHHARVVTVNTPAGLPPDQQCGKGVHLDMHVTNATSAIAGGGPGLGGGGLFSFNFPQDCGPLQQGEEALAFILFDLAACIQNDNAPPTAPPLQ